MYPLQIGIPGGPELMIVLLILLLSFGLAFAFAYYVYNDAERRGDENAALWAVVAGLAAIVGTPVAGLLVVVVYVWQRD